MYKVELINRQTIGARCGHGEGETLREAQDNAIRLAKERGTDVELSGNGWRVFFDGGVNC